MAAVDPSVSPKQQNSPAEELETSGRETDVLESGCSLTQTGETIPIKTQMIPDNERGPNAVRDGGCIASHSEVSAESGAGADKTTFKSPDQAVSTEKMTETPGSDKREYEWSETEDDDKEAKTQTKENSKCDISDVTSSAKEVPQVTSVDTNIAAVDAKDFSEEDPSFSTSRSNEKRAEGEQLAEEPVGDVDGTQDTLVDQEEGVERGEAADPSAKIKKCRLVCKECGKRFARREMFNLHRHFHAHEDELTPLTCKECGLTFQHRSSLIKHRNEHKEKEELLVTPKKERETMEKGRFQCAECKSIFSMADDLRDHNCCNTVEKPFHCPLCRQEFQFKVSITKHMMSHSIENTHSCQECSQTFPHATALRLHQRSHSALKPYECPECGLVFKHYSFMEDHRRKHTKNTRSHLCNICGKSFKYSSLLHQHQYLHTGQKPFRCLECGKQFAFAQNMKAHCRQHRLRQTKSAAVQPSKQAPVSIPETVRGPGKENTYQIEEPKRTFSCPLCPQTYQVPASLRAHMLIHEAEYEKLERTPRPPSENDKFWEKGHNCPHCPCIYRDEYSLNLHIKSVHKSAAQPLENVSAPPSNKQFIPLSRESAQGKCRSDVTSSIKSYKCSECGKTFRHRSVLELHMRIHSKGKPYQCNECGKTFRFSSYLQQHLIIHTGKKPYKCSDCGKDFAFLQNMRSHQKLHQEKPFRCTSCRKGYSDETQLQHHMLTHNGDKPHKCHLCDKTFGLAYLLRDHMNTHTGERPHHCEECHKTFSWFSSLLVHQKIHARRRSSYSQYNYSPIGARMRGRGNRGRRGGRLTGGWSRSLGSPGMVSSQPSPYIGSALRDAELQRRAVQTQSAMLSSHVDLQGTQKKEPWLPELQPQPVQWKVDGGEVKPVPSSQQPHAAPQQHHQKSPVWADSLAKTQSGPTAHSSESAHMRDSATSSVSSLLPAVPKKSSPSAAVSEMEQHRQPKPVTWSSTLTSTTLASSSSLQLDFSVPSFVDGALWSIRPPLLANSQSRPGQELQPPRWSVAPMSMQKEPSTPPKKEDSRVWDMNNPSTVSQPENPWNSCDLQNQWASGLAGASTSAQLDQSSAMSISTPVSHGVGSTLWDLQTPPGIPKTITSPETLINSQEFQLQQKQVSSGWTNVQSPASQQKVPISIQYEPHCFGQGMGAPVWGFQSHPVGPQTLLPGQLKPGNGQELQQQPMVTGTQIIINPPSPFFSPPLAPLPPLALPGPPHPLHSVAVGALSRPPHPNLFFTPQAVMSERSHMPQTLALPQLVPRTEPHKLGARLPFAPERLLQCMICGCSLPRELDLQMHYLQHAQGEI